jgi:hypothetical protein
MAVSSTLFLGLHRDFLHMTEVLSQCGKSQPGLPGLGIKRIAAIIGRLQFAFHQCGMLRLHCLDGSRLKT